jgi:E3 ubiquitin-protein ligase RFWD2
VHLFDLRSPRRPLAVLKGHGRAVSYVRWARPDSLVTASTDATLRLWTASGGRGSSGGTPGGAGTAAAAAAAAAGGSGGSRCSSDGEEGGWHCAQVFRGHANSKHFVGLATHGPFIACGSETNEVFVYHHGLAQPSMRAPLQASSWGGDGGDGGGVVGGDGAAAGSSAAAAAAAAKPPFVSALAWRPGSDVLLAANSRGGIWLLGMQ